MLTNNLVSFPTASTPRAQCLAQLELHRQILARYRREGTGIFFPIRTVYLKQEPKGEASTP